MRTSVFVFAMSMLLACTASPNDDRHGGILGLLPEEDICHQCPPDLEGFLAESYRDTGGWDTEVANDFLVEDSTWVYLVRWWGGYSDYNSDFPTESEHVIGFYLRFYADDDCMPAGIPLLEAFVPTNCNETFVHEQLDGSPVYEYSCFISVHLNPGTYWFSVQGDGISAPPQWNRLACQQVEFCESVFRGEYYSHPDWASAADVFGEIVDASQEIHCGEPPDHLLTTAWHQNVPYNADCPIGNAACDSCVNGDPSHPSAVGCVATATAQVMNYHKWPWTGVGSHSYNWGG